MAKVQAQEAMFNIGYKLEAVENGIELHTVAVLDDDGEEVFAVPVIGPLDQPRKTRISTLLLKLLAEVTTLPLSGVQLTKERN